MLGGKAMWLLNIKAHAGGLGNKTIQRTSRNWLLYPVQVLTFPTSVLGRRILAAHGACEEFPQVKWQIVIHVSIHRHTSLYNDTK